MSPQIPLIRKGLSEWRVSSQNFAIAPSLSICSLAGENSKIKLQLVEVTTLSISGFEFWSNNFVNGFQTE